MTGATASEPAARPAGPRLRLVGLMGVVVAVALGAAVIRVGERSTDAEFLFTERVFHIPVYAAAVLGAGLCLMLLRDLRCREAVAVGDDRHWARRCRSRFIAWRVATVALLAWLLVAVVQLWERMALRSDAAQNLNGPTFPVRHGLLMVVAPMALFGAVLAARPPVFPRGPRRRRWRCWTILSGLLMPAAGLVMVAIHAVIPYLVMIAIRNVRLAMPLRDLSRWPQRPDFHAPFARTVPACALSLLALGVMTAWLIHDFRRPLSKPATSAGSAARVVSLLVVLGLAGWLLARSVASFEPIMAEGLLAAIGFWELVIAAAGIAMLAGGLAARGLSRQLDDRPATGRRLPPPVVWILRGLAISFSAVMILWAGETIARTLGVTEPLIPEWLARVTTGPVVMAITWVLLAVGFSAGLWQVVLYPPILTAYLMGLFALVRLMIVPFRGERERPAPLDRVLSDDVAARRWLWLVVAVTLTSLASLVIVGTSGVLAFHFLLRAIPA